MYLSKIISILVIIFFCFPVNAQDDTTVIGVKAGLNLSKYSPNSSTKEYTYKEGFYVGVFYNVNLENRFNFRPSLMFSLQGSKATTQVEITDTLGNPLPGSAPYDFEYSTHDFVIAIPLALQLYLGERFYMESGPRFDIIVDQASSSSSVLLSGTGSELEFVDDETFEFMVQLGFGYDISKRVSIQIGSFSGLGKRNNGAKSFGFNFGLEAKL